MLCCTFLDDVFLEKRKRRKPKIINAGVARFVVSTTNSMFLRFLVPVSPASVPISLSRNVGQPSGHVRLSSNGLVLGHAGDANVSWQINFTSVLFVDDSFPPPPQPVAVNVFVVQNGQFNPDTTQPNLIGTVVFLQSLSAPQVAQGTGILFDVPGGTLISLVATSSSGNTINLVEPAWFISVSQIASTLSKCC